MSELPSFADYRTHKPSRNCLAFVSHEKRPMYPFLAYYQYEEDAWVPAAAGEDYCIEVTHYIELPQNGPCAEFKHEYIEGVEKPFSQQPEDRVVLIRGVNDYVEISRLQAE